MLAAPEHRELMPTLDIDALATTAAQRRSEFLTAAPFPHVVFDDFLRREAVEGLLGELDVPGNWTFYHHVNEKKRGLTDLGSMGPTSRAVIADLQSDAFLRILETLTGVDRLVSDPDLDGGGIQQTEPGGYLNVHTDFLSHAKRRTWSRQINLLLFLNRDWDESYKGWLEFWDADVTRCVRRIAPACNRCVIFRTSRISFHGVPAGVACPPGRARKSLALYYFRDEGRVCPLTSTRYMPLPGDPAARRLLIRLDRWLIHAYSLLKRYTPIDNATVSRILRHF